MIYQSSNPRMEQELGDLLLVTPAEERSDPVESMSNNVDPLSTDSDQLHSDPGFRFFQSGRKNEGLKIPLNVSGDERVTSLLHKAMADMCSSKIGEMEFKKKNEWIVEWRRLRYPNSESLECRAMEKSAQHVLDYDCIRQATPGTFTPATSAFRNKSCDGPTVLRANVGYNTDGYRSTSNPTEIPRDHVIKTSTEEPARSSKCENRKSPTVVFPITLKPSLVQTSRTPSIKSKLDTGNHEANTNVSTIPETPKTSADVLLSIPECSIDDQRSELQRNAAEHTKTTKNKSTKTKRSRKRRYSQSKKKSSLKTIKAQVDISIDLDKSCSNQDNPQEKLASCKESHGNVPRYCQSPNKDLPGQDHPLAMECSPDDEFNISLDQSSPPRIATQGDPVCSAEHNSCANCAASHLPMMIDQSPTSCDTQTTSSCPGETLNDAIKSQPNVGSCPYPKESASSTVTGSNYNVDQIRTSSKGVQNNDELSAHSGSKQNRDDNTCGKSSNSLQRRLLCQCHKICRHAPHNNMPHQICGLDCSMNPFFNAHIYKRYNCCSCHQHNTLNSCGKTSADMCEFPHTNVCNGTTHPVGQVYETCQHSTCTFSQNSPLNKFERENDSRLNVCASPSILHGCNARKVEHGSDFQANSIDYDSNCETRGNCSCNSMGRHFQNRLTPMQWETSTSGPHHSIGHPCHRSQPPLMVGKRKKFLTCDCGIISCENGSLSLSHHETGHKNLKTTTIRRETGKSTQSSTCAFKDNKFPLDHNSSVPFNSNCMHRRHSHFPVAVNTSQIPSTKYFPKCCTKLLTDSAYSTTSQSPNCGKEMCPSVESQDCQIEHCRSSGLRTPCLPVKVETANISARNDRVSREIHFSINDAHCSAHTMAPHTNEISFHDVESYNRNSTKLFFKRRKPLDVGSIAVKLPENPRHSTSVSTESSDKRAPQNALRNPKCELPSSLTVPRFMGQCCSENSKPLNTTVAQRAMCSYSQPRTSTSPALPGREQASPDVIVISDDDDPTHEKLNDTCTVHSSLENTGQSSNSFRQPRQSINPLGRRFESLSPIEVYSDEYDKDDQRNGNAEASCINGIGSSQLTNNRFRQPSTNKVEGRKESLDPIVISSDDDETDGHVAVPHSA